MKSTSNAFYVIIMICVNLMALGIVIFFVIAELMGVDEQNYTDLYCETYNEGWQIYECGEYTPVSLPGNFDLRKNVNSLILSNTIGSTDGKDLYISFSSAKQDIKVYVGKELRYFYSTKENRIYTSFSSDIQTYVPIYPTDEGKEIWVIFYGNNNYTGVVSRMLIGTQLGITINILHENMWSILGAILLMVMGFLSMALGIFTRFAYKKPASISYLGLGVFFAGFWMIAESDVRQYLVTNSSILGNMTYLCIIIMPMVFALYFDAVQNGRYRIFYMLVAMLNIVEAVISVVLQINRMVDLVESLLYSFILIVADVVIYLITVIPDIKKGYVKEYWLEFIGILGGIAAAIYTISIYYSKPYSLKGFTLCGGLLFVVIMAYFRAFKDVLGLERSVNAAVQAQESSTEFLTRMSHEMRTPINAILGMNKMILKESKDSEILEYARDVNGAGNYLLSIVNEILDLSKVNSGSIDLDVQEYDLIDMLRECYSLIIPRAKASRLAFSVDVDDVLPSKLYGDKDRIVQIITNLLTNAVKFTPEGHVALTVTGKISSGKLLLMISVEDSGVGIDEEVLPYVFDSFKRVGTLREGHIEGTGLGLSITKRFVDVMDGTITVESVKGKGTVFSVIIPQGIATIEPCGSFSMGPNGDRRVADRTATYDLSGKILVVDDVAINLRVFSMFLKNTGVIVETAKSGTEALEKIKDTRYDIIFLDHLMPGIDGIKLKEMIDSLEDNINKNTPIIMQTANAVIGAKEEYINLGFADYIAKPIKEEVLLALLKKYLYE